MESRRRTPQSQESSSQEFVNGVMLDSENKQRKASLWEEKGGLALLLSLYTLQGVPQGLMATIPMLLQAGGAKYSAISFFALAIYPFSFKVFWSPIVDSVFNIQFGRRRSWIVPTQMLIGILFLYLSFHAEQLIIEDSIYELTFLFFVLIFMTATQDIAVDGWGLTLLSEHNRGYASNCQTCGLNIGIYTAFSGFLSLNSIDFCNDYLRSSPSAYPLVTLGGFLYAVGICFICVTILVATVIPEKAPTGIELAKLHSISLKKTLSQIKHLLRIKPLLTLLFVMLTNDIAFAACDSVSGLKLVEKGVSKERVAIMDLFSLPVAIFMSIYVVHRVRHHRFYDPWLAAFKVRWFLCITAAIVVYNTPTVTTERWFEMVFTIQLVAYRAAEVMMFVCQGACWSYVSDESIGGTYMTLLATCSNFGKSWVRNVGLLLVDPLTWKCSDEGDLDCHDLDGYYVLTGICAIFGLIWYYKMHKKVDKLMDVPKDDWKINTHLENKLSL